MKKFLKKLILIALLLAAFTSPMSVSADVNVDGGGGDLGSGDSQNFWRSGDDGARVTVVDARTGAKVKGPLDFSNEPRTNIQLHFNLNMKKNANGTPQAGGYNSVLPGDTPLPTIIKASGASDVPAIKSYFGDKKVVEFLAGKFNMKYEDLTSGKYKLFIEPILYLTYQGGKLAMTPTEGAKFSQSEPIRTSNVGIMVASQGPLAMFLEEPDLTFPAYEGPRTGIMSIQTIIDELGMCIVSFDNAKKPCCEWHDPVNCTCLNKKDDPNDCSCPKDHNHPDTPCKEDDPKCKCKPKPEPPIPPVAPENPTDEQIIRQEKIVIRENEMMRYQFINPNWGVGSTFTVDGEPPESEDISILVEKSAFWHKDMFKELKNLYQLFAAKPKFELGYKYNRSTDFLHYDDPTGIFLNDNIFRLNVASHRGGINSAAGKEPELAKYMEKTTINQAYINFMKNGLNLEPPAKYKLPTGNFGGTSSDMIVKTTHGGEATAEIDGEEVTGDISKLTFEIPIQVEPTIESEAKKNNSYDTKKFVEYSKDKGTTITLTTASEPVKFNPTFKMNYSSVSNMNNQDLWVLGKGEKTYITQDVFLLETSQGKTAAWGTWSLDRADREFGDTYKNANGLAMRILKAGNPVTLTTKETKLTAKALIHLQDPNFVDPADRAAVQEKNNKKYQEVVDAFNSVDQSISSELGFYSNLWYASTEGTYSYKAQKDDYDFFPYTTSINKAIVPDERDATEFVGKPLNKDTVNLDYTCEIYNIACDNTVDAKFSRPVTLKSNGFKSKFSSKTIFPTELNKDLNDNGMWKMSWLSDQFNYALTSSKNLNNIMERGKGRNGWYNEDYEGIYAAYFELTYDLGDVESKITQIHSYMSDWQTDTNFYARDFVHPSNKQYTVIKGSIISNIVGSDKVREFGDFGVGIEIPVSTIKWGGNVVEDIAMLYTPATFGVRGHVTDNT